MAEYFQLLSPADQAQYFEKCKYIDHIDPYSITSKDFSKDQDKWPDITYMDLVNYLVFSPNPLYTAENMKAYKSLDAHNQFVSGWVREVQVAHMKDIYIIRGTVLHSQSIRNAPTSPWILANKEGIIITAHCDCKAGTGGTCTHVAAVLFYLEAATRIRKSRTVTETKAYWLLPSGVKNVVPAPASEIDFSSSQTRRRRFSQAVQASCSESQPNKVPFLVSQDVPKPSFDEQQAFLEALNTQNRKPAILTVSAPFNTQFKPKTTDPQFPKPLTDLHSDVCCSMDKSALHDHCQTLDIQISHEEAQAVEAATKKQSKCNLWYIFRAGRITASVMKEACQTSLNQPSISLIKKICYPDQTKFTSAATEWGCAHESAARQDYEDHAGQFHQDLCVCDSGFVINPQYPEIGATPDAVVMCKCCGSGVLEIKCPYSTDDPTQHNCLISEDNGTTYKLNHNHNYYYQVQTQLFVCDASYADFVLWTNGKIHYERIMPQKDFWEKICSKASAFFHQVILLELVGRYFTRTAVTSFPIKCLQPSKDTVKVPATSPKWCLCRGEEKLPMVGCDNENCEFQWFHYKCVSIRKAPKGQWFCPKCKDNM